MIIEYYLFVFMYMKFNDLLKKVFLNFDNQIFDRLWMDLIYRYNYFFILEIVILLDIIILYVRENL